MTDLLTRIPAEKLENCHQWSVPEVSSKNIVPSVSQSKKNISRDEINKNKQTEVETNKSVDNLANDANNPSNSSGEDEIVETVTDIDVDSLDENSSPMTAEQLQKITEDAEKEGFDQGYEKGHEEGLEVAKKEGHEQGLDDAKEEVAEQVDRLEKIMTALLIPLESEQQAVEQQIVELVYQLTQAVVKRELVTDSSLITEVVNESLKLLPASEQTMNVYLNSQDLELVKAMLDESSLQCHCHIDDTLLPGGCRLENNDSTIDASIEKRLQQVLDDFSSQRYASDEGIDESEATKEDSTKTNIDKNSDASKGSESLIDDVPADDTPNKKPVNKKPDVESEPENIQEGAQESEIAGSDSLETSAPESSALETPASNDVSSDSIGGDKDELL